MEKRYSAPPALTIDEKKKYTAVMATSKGAMTFKFFATEAPNTVNNFIFLAREGYYNDVVFHRIIKNFMAQSGDPTGTGAGSPGYSFKDEPVTRNYERGTIAMANAGPNTNGSQFFIMTQNYPLPKNYTIFGILTDGLDTLEKIASTPVGPSPSGERSAPTEKVSIKSVEVKEE